MVVESSQLASFVDRVSALDGDEAYGALRDLYAIRRTHPTFWSHSDKLHAAYRELETVDWGLLDYSRLENR